ncbi:CPBP family intramembrane glutamic endopeptidase [Brassicibacter mesophilus]|uniref:CPBP family intramembrane glutamic endopeptidase n=1 Tax=Brassicibacter mesophilus TaxID=745119 RepID=UPI003D2426B3
MSGFAVISLLFNFIIGIALLVYYFSNFKEVNSYIKYGIFVLGVYIVLTAFGGGIDVSSIPMLIIPYVKLAIYTCIGMHLCSKLGFRDMPLLRKVFRDNTTEKISIKSYTLSTIAVIIGSVGFSYILFKLTTPSASEAIKRSIDNGDVVTDLGGTLSVDIILLFIGVVIAEEIIFRFVIPNYLAVQFKLGENKYWITIVASSILWALAHANTLDPEWVKFVQIFPVGLALGAIYKKYGLESCIIAHSGFNILMIYVAGGLIA